MFVKHDKIRSFLLQLNDPSNDWKDMALFESLIFECRDCLQLLRDNSLDRSSMYQYLTYRRLELIIKRNLRLVATLQNPADILRQYEIIIGGYNEIKQLPLSTHFSDSYLVERFLSEMDAHVTMNKAYRCYYIGLVAKSNWKESVALFDRAGFYAKEALNNEFIVDKHAKEELQKLLSKADGDKFALFSQSISKGVSETKDDTASDPNLPLVEQLDKFNYDPEVITGNIPLISLTPEYRAIPCKPLFFDLALNHIQFPNLDEEINANKPKAGLTGMVKGWLGGWRK
ncbi:hypothetical protein RDWZM_004819 [Blomia tropicalis]|uniref:Signal recognition particle subunit SRP68 n=1 Tax=Blomia tropicalis TaxID=40697 RepID=A0A9Q0M4T6_BLOTA|nr:hypothetical protein RDWZM_004819 [Blomia tropicalis]